MDFVTDSSKAVLLLWILFVIYVSRLCLSYCLVLWLLVFVCLFDLILYVPSTIIQLNRDGSSWVEPVLS